MILQRLLGIISCRRQGRYRLKRRPTDAARGIRRPIWRVLDEFMTGASNPARWAGLLRDDMLATTNARLDPALLRIQRPADCTRRLLPDLLDAMDVHPLKYAWIDTNWRPQ
jgi:hypothetical protein